MFRILRVSVLMVVSGLVSGAQAVTTFEHRFNLHDDWSQYLDSAINAEVYTELIAGGSQPATFWRPTPINTWGIVTYHFPMSFEISTANLNTSVHAFTDSHLDLAAEAYVDVSGDGVSWTTVLNSYLGSTGPEGGPVDITSIVSGAEDVWVRARLWSTLHWPTDGSIFAQFMRAGHTEIPVSQGGNPHFSLNVVGNNGSVPEPTTLGLVLAGLIVVGMHRRHRDMA